MKKRVRGLVKAVAVLAAASLLTACGAKTGGAGEGVTVKVGVVGEYNEYWKPAIEALAKENIKVELVNFSEYSLPNQALSDKEIDLNAFQHYAYLKNEMSNKGFDLTVVGESIIAPLGLYSKKISNLDGLKDGDTIAIPKRCHQWRPLAQDIGGGRAAQSGSRGRLHP